MTATAKKNTVCFTTNNSLGFISTTFSAIPQTKSKIQTSSSKNHFWKF